MVKFLLSLMLLASSWAWGAEVFDGVAETKGGLDAPSVIKEILVGDYERDKELYKDFFALYQNTPSFISDKDLVWIIPLDIANKSRLLRPNQSKFLKELFPFESQFFLDELFKELDTIKKQFFLMDQYSPNAVRATLHYLAGESVDWSALSASDLVDAISLRLNLGITDDRDLLMNPKLLNIILSQLLSRAGSNDPGILQLLQDDPECLDQIIINLSQTVPGTSASWSPDGSRLWVQFKDHDVVKTQIYHVTAGKLVAIGVAVPSLKAGLSPDGSKLLMFFYDDGVNQIQLYQITTEGLEVVGAAVPGSYASWSPDGSKLWTMFKDHDVNKIQLYQVTTEGLEVVDAAVPGSYASWSPDGSKLWVKFRDDGVLKIRLYQVADGGLEAVGAAVLGYESGFSPDGSRLWVKFRDHDVEQIQIYRATEEELVAVGEVVFGEYAKFSSDGSKLCVRFVDNGVDQIQLYQVTAEGLEVVGAAVPGFEAGFSSDGSRLWVKFSDNSIVFKMQLYQVTAEGLEVVGEAVPGESAGFSSDGSKLWIMFKDHGVYQIQLYQVTDEGLVAVGAAVPGYADFSSDGSRLSISNIALNQITVYLNLPLMDLDLLLKQFIPNSVLYQNLNFGQQMLLIYILREHQGTGAAYNLPVKLGKAWSFLPDALKSYLLENNIVIVNWPTVRSHDAAGLGDDSKVD